MERSTWTDERLDDLNRRVESGFARTEARLDNLDSTFRAEIRGLASDMRVEIESLRQTTLRIGGGMLITLIGALAAVVARGL